MGGLDARGSMGASMGASVGSTGNCTSKLAGIWNGLVWAALHGKISGFIRAGLEHVQLTVLDFSSSAPYQVARVGANFWMFGLTAHQLAVLCASMIWLDRP